MPWSKDYLWNTPQSSAGRVKHGKTYKFICTQKLTCMNGLYNQATILWRSWTTMQQFQLTIQDFYILQEAILFSTTNSFTHFMSKFSVPRGIECYGFCSKTVQIPWGRKQNSLCKMSIFVRHCLCVICKHLQVTKSLCLLSACDTHVHLMPVC